KITHHLFKRSKVIDESNPKINLDGSLCSCWCGRVDLVSFSFTHDVSNPTRGQCNGSCITRNKGSCRGGFYDRFAKVYNGDKFSFRFPGGMIGAFCSGLLYRKFQKRRWAVVGEIIGTGIISSLFSVPFAKYVMGISYGAFFFMPSFMISS